MMEEELARSGRKLDVALESHQLVTVGRMVASGPAAVRAPALCEAQMTSLGAVCIPLDNPPIEKCIGVIHPGHTQLSKAAHALLETLKDFYQPGQGRETPAARREPDVGQRIPARHTTGPARRPVKPFPACPEKPACRYAAAGSGPPTALPD